MSPSVGPSAPFVPSATPNPRLQRSNDGLPGFLIVGAMKSGTTTLAVMLARHPGIYMHPAKELHFFDRYPDRGLDWYRAQFRGAQRGSLVGEATPEYMFDPRASDLMAEVLPAARLVVILRDPVDRAYSHYWHNRMHDREPLSFHDALAAERQRTMRSRIDRWRYSYATRGLYADQLRHLERWYPREAIHVMLTSDLLEQPQKQIDDVVRFLGLSMGGLAPSGRLPREGRYQAVRSWRLRNVTNGLRRCGPFGRQLARVAWHLNHVTIPYPPMSADDRRRLRAFYREPDTELESWLDRDLSAWRG